MKRGIATIALLTFATAALAQGPGPGAKGPGFNFGPDNTRGWSLMSSQERAEHRDKMLGFKTYDECKAYLEEHHKQMEARAKEQGKSIPEAPRRNMCDRMKQAGRLN